MSDELTITAGGAIVVDSSALREIAERLGEVTRRLREADGHLAGARGELAAAPDIEQRTGDLGIEACRGRLDGLARLVEKASRGAVLMADTFEVVELRAEQEALSAAQPEAAAALRPRIDELLARPAVGDSVISTMARWERERVDGSVDQPLDRSLGLAGALLGSLGILYLGPAVLPLTGVLGVKPVESAVGIVRKEAGERGLGVLPFGTTLRGSAPDVTVQRVAASTTTPPANLRDMVTRVPYGKPGQVAVEKYTMKDGTTRYVTYLDGTRTMKSGTTEPWDMDSNIDMYLEHDRAASQQAVLEALEAAGAEPGDQVDLVGYSQGGAIASFMAMDSPYRTDTVILAGSPNQPSLTDDQTLVDLRHRGDIVSNLATGGAPGGTGSPESFEIIREPERDANPITPHDFAEYVKTAELADRSGDARVDALQRDFFDELAQASKVERTEFRGARD